MAKRKNESDSQTKPVTRKIKRLVTVLTSTNHKEVDGEIILKNNKEKQELDVKDVKKLIAKGKSTKAIGDNNDQKISDGPNGNKGDSKLNDYKEDDAEKSDNLSEKNDIGKRKNDSKDLIDEDDEEKNDNLNEKKDAGKPKNDSNDSIDEDDYKNDNKPHEKATDLHSKFDKLSDSEEEKVLIEQSGLKSIANALKQLVDDNMEIKTWIKELANEQKETNKRVNNLENRSSSNLPSTSYQTKLMKNDELVVLIEYDDQEIYISKDLLEKAKTKQKEHKPVFSFTKIIFPALVDIKDVIRRSRTGRKGKNFKAKFSAEIEKILLLAAQKHIQAPASSYQQEVKDAITEKLTNFNSLFTRIMKGEIYSDSLVKDCKLVQEDPVYLKSFNQYKTRQQLLDLDEEILKEISVKKQEDEKDQEGSNKDEFNKDESNQKKTIKDQATKLKTAKDEIELIDEKESNKKSETTNGKTTKGIKTKGERKENQRVKTESGDKINQNSKKMDKKKTESKKLKYKLNPDSDSETDQVESKQTLDNINQLMLFMNKLKQSKNNKKKKTKKQPVIEEESETTDSETSEDSKVLDLRSSSGSSLED